MAQVDYIKQIQTKVNRRIRIINKDFGVSKQQVRSVYSTVVKTPSKPTTREITQVTELLAQQFSVTEKTLSLDLAEVPEQISPISSLHQSPTTTEIKRENTPDMWETLPLAEQHQESQSLALEASPSGNLPETSPRRENAITTTGNNFQAIPTHQPTAGTNITPTEMTVAIAMAVKQVGENGNTEAIQLLTSLAEELSSDISDTQEMVAALVSAYLDKRQSVLSNAIGTLNNLRSAQTSSFQSGLNNDFFAQKTRSKRQFLTQIETMFN